MKVEINYAIGSMLDGVFMILCYTRTERRAESLIQDLNKHYNNLMYREITKEEKITFCDNITENKQL